MLDDYRVGNFNVNQLEEISERCRQIGFIKRSLKLDEKCLQCEYYSLCRGGCQRNRDYEQFNDNYVNYFCPSYKMFFEHCKERLEDVVKKIHKKQSLNSKLR
jgi:uncharacterized protein